MNILIDINHPAHLHNYRNLARLLENAGHRIVWTVKEKDVAGRLLDAYGISFEYFPRRADGIVGKMIKQAANDVRLRQIYFRERIDVGIGTSISAVFLSKITKADSVLFDDDDDDLQPWITRWVHPFATHLLSPEALKGRRRRRDTIFYSGYHELAYLHPRRFLPDRSVLDDAGITGDEPFFVLRFGALKAHHDGGIRGLSLEQKCALIEMLKPQGKIFITAERAIEPELSEYRLPVPPEKIHSLLAYAALFIGDGQTMASEAAVLGTPSLRCNSVAGRVSTLEELEKRYGLTYAFTPDRFKELTAKLKELLAMRDLRDEWRRRRMKMLSEKIDVTAFWAWFMENYPESADVMKKDPDFQHRFKSGEAS